MALGAPAALEPIISAVGRQGSRAAARVRFVDLEELAPVVNQEQGFRKPPPPSSVQPHRCPPVATHLPPLNLNFYVQSPTLRASSNHAGATTNAAKLQ